MKLLRLPSPEQDVLDNFDVKLVREDIDSEKNKKIMENLFLYQRFTDLAKINNSCSDLFKTKKNTYFVYNGNIVGIIHGSPSFKSKMKFLPENLGDLSKLAFLLIMGTQIVKIPRSIGKLKNLRFLEIFGNSNLFSLPDSISELSRLKELHLGNNNLTALPENIGNLSNLKKIKLGSNQLVILPDSFKKLNLDYMEILENPLRSLANINFMPRIFFDITTKNLTKKGISVLDTFNTDYGDDISEEAMDITGDEKLPREMEPASDYYKKSPIQLALEYSKNPNSLNVDEKERLAWEGGFREREILELGESKILTTDSILLEINKRLKVEFSFKGLL